LQQAGVRYCYRAFAKLLRGQSRNTTSLSWMQLKYAQIKTDEYLGLGFSDTIFKLKLVELFDNNSSREQEVLHCKAVDY